MWPQSSDYHRYLISLLVLIVVLISNSSQQKLVSTASIPSPVNSWSAVSGSDDDAFVPIVPPTKSKETVKIESSNNNHNHSDDSNPKLLSPSPPPSKRTEEEYETMPASVSIRLQDVQRLLADLMQDKAPTTSESNAQKRSTNDPRALIADLLFNENTFKRVKKFTEKYIFKAASGSAFNQVLPAAGRVFLFKGFKKLMWPIFIGVQVAKTVLLAMFLPSIIGSIGKMVGKGLVSVSGFGHPTETVDDFEFKDNPPIDDTATNGMGYNYPQQTITANSLDHATFDAAPSHTNNMLSLYDIQDAKPQFNLQNTQQYQLPEYAQNSRKETLQSKKDDFKVFHDIPASSMLLTNYDPFYSPLLSRLDSVFHQLSLNGDNESCREKLVCLMYASPAKYMPYSNLVSAQLSRELNELRKPTSDNPEILRFFKYMRAARDGQDGKNCHTIYKKCSSFTDTEQPAMLTTFNDINKLVQARKLH